MKNKVYKVITDKFIESLERGVIPWEKPWSTAGVLPSNGLTGRQYSGVNILLLGMMPYSQPYWLTFNQAKKAGGNVKKGESSTPVTFWKMLYKDKKTGEKLSRGKAKKWLKNADKRGRVKTIPLLRYYNVFNIEQCENLDEDKIKRAPVKTYDFEPVEKAAEIWDNYPGRPELKTGGGAAYYTPSLDTIQMPENEHFKSPELYYKTLFHESIHSTGAKHRLNRELNGNMRTKSYSKEELTAEIGAAFLNNAAGILEPVFENSEAYIKNWLQALKDEDNQAMIVGAAARAEKAANHILNID